MKPEEDLENPSELTKLLMSLQPCVACDGRGTVGAMGSYERPIRVTCSHCFGTGKEGGDHIRFANTKDAILPFGAGHGSAAILKRLRFSGVADYELDPGVCKAAANEIERLRDWIRAEGKRTDQCTCAILGEICDGCRCERLSLASRGA